MNAALKQKNILLLTAFFNKECMCLYPCHSYSGMQRAFFYAALYCLTHVACQRLFYFFTLPHKSQDFRKKLLNIKCVF
jgi:hypothetical protein